MIVFTANGRCAKIKTAEPITTGSVGMPVSVVLSGDFDGLAATMVFACGDVSADVALMGQEVTVPPQVLEEAGRVLEIGVYGARADGTIVIPTVWAKAGMVHEGVLPSGVDPASPTPSWVAQVQQWAEDAHDTAEQLAQDVESWEAEIDAAIENARDATQDATQTAASIAQAETARVTAEQARASAESSRAAAESARVTAEASRASAEQSRVSAETVRTTAEQGRVTAETSRANAESARATAETGRATAEQARAAAETARASAESVRVTTEQGRVSAENARASAESARVSAESARASAETSRANAETARSNAESARATEWATIKTEAQDTISAAEDATDAAESAASDANDAAALATRAAAATWNAGNVLKGTLAEGTVLTTDDAWAAPPESVNVYGKSTQDGTPTPDAPVPIESVDELAANFSPDVLWTNLDNGYVNISGGINSASVEHAEKVTPFIPLASNAVNVYVRTPDKPSSDSQWIGIGIYDSNKTFIRRVNPVWSLYVNEFEDTVRISDANAAYIRISMRTYGSNNIVWYYSKTTVSDLLPEGTSLRSLPDGTRDTLTLTYQGPSTREGWGVFDAKLVQRVARIIYDGTQTIVKTSDGNFAFQNPAGMFGEFGYNTTTQSLSDRFKCHAAYNGRVEGEAYIWSNYTYFTLADTYTTVEEATEWLTANTPEFIGHAATPITHSFGEVELPVLPAPTCTVWCGGGSAQPTLAMEYEQDINIVIARLKDTIADMATS